MLEPLVKCFNVTVVSHVMTPKANIANFFQFMCYLMQ